MEFFGLLPDLCEFAEVIQHQQPVLRHGAEEGADVLRGPVRRIGIEEPTHLEPHRLGIDLRHRLVDVARHSGERFRIPRRGVDLVERIGAVDMARAEQTGLFGEELPLDDREKRVHRVEETAPVSIVEAAPVAHACDPGIGMESFELLRNVSREGRQHGFHPQFAFARQNTLLQRQLAVDPLLGQRTLPAVDVRHAVPRQVGRTGEVGADLFVRKSEPGPYPLPDSFLPRDGQRHGYALKRHPVDEAFPFGPSPPRHGVPERAVIEEETLSCAGFDADFFVDPR